MYLSSQIISAIIGWSDLSTNNITILIRVVSPFGQAQALIKTKIFCGLLECSFLICSTKLSFFHKLILYWDNWGLFPPTAEIYNLIFEHLTYSAILVPNRNTWQKYFSSAHFSTEIIETFWGGKEDDILAGNKFLGCLETLELLEKG